LCGEFDGVLLQFVAHVDIFNDGLFIRHLEKRSWGGKSDSVTLTVPIVLLHFVTQ
jgi:hypothetical protein